jgi:WD40 repeat protein
VAYITSALFSPDGKVVLTASTDGNAKLWGAHTGQPLSQTFRHNGEILAAAFSPDGKLVLTAGRDQVARLWETDTGKRLGRPLQHEGPVRRVVFSPDGRLVLTGSDDNTARLWDKATTKPLGPPLKHDKPITNVAFGPAGKTVLTQSAKIARLWDLPVPVEETPERIVLWAKVSTGMEVGEDGLARVMGAQAWKQNKESLDSLGAPP